MAKLNPFTPNNPVHTGMFVGRVSELNATEKALVQTSAGNPTHLLILGERGIGKTSLLNVAQVFSRGEFKWGEINHNFLTVRVPLDEKLCLADFSINLKKAIERQVYKENPDVAWLNGAWNFLTRFEVAGVAYRKDESNKNDTQIIQEAAYSLVDTVKKLRDPIFVNKKDGLVILIDEADKASKDLHLGSFLKNLSETLISEGQNYVLFVLTGLPNLRDVLMESHESSLRLFKELNLKPLSKEETTEVVKKGLDEANEKNSQSTTIESDANQAIFGYSEGYPHFVQQIGFSVFETDTDNNITREDVNKGFFMDGGALEQIGARYYRKLFYVDISTEQQRTILKIMSENWNNWIKREEIKKKFTGTEANLDNGLRALRDKNIIIPREGFKGQYRLQWASFAFWITNHDKAKHRN